MINRKSLIICLYVSLLSIPQTQAQNTDNAQLDRTVSGEFIVEPTTLIAAGFEWYIEGDDNRNAQVSLQYRKRDSEDWLEGLPLLRLQREELNDVYGAYTYIAPNMFAGSLFDLEPNTQYDVKLTLSDPDGVNGASTQQLTIKTREEPLVPEEGNIYHVYPPGHVGEKQQPAFTGLLSAYYLRANGADWFNAFPPRVQPGDIIKVHAGLYQADRYRYGDSAGILFDGTYHLLQGGTEENPIFITAAGDGEVIFDGGGNHILFDVMAADYLHFEGITIRNTEVGIQAGYKELTGAIGLTVKHSRFEDVGRGIYTDWSGSSQFYIADNIFIGKSHPDRLEGWIGDTWQDTPGFPTPSISELAIKVYGAGHVIAHNYVANFHDGIDHATYGLPEGYPDLDRAHMPVSIDIYNNDITNVDDNCIEADGAMFNIRIMRNRCFNQGHRSLSTQPVLGGPAYFIRNVIYHAPESGSLKLTASSAGVLVYHNTFTSEVLAMGPVSNTHYRNNLILGQDTADSIFTVETFTDYSSSDYNGFRPNPGKAVAFSWTGPSESKVADFTGDLQKQEFATLDEYRTATKNESHSELVDYDIFVDVPKLSTNEPWTLYDPSQVDFQLKPESAAIDTGQYLPNINDDFTGTAPDLGAYERGGPVPHYGPRSR